jgi:predicted enzyme related to lactoylglutathione lyase
MIKGMALAVLMLVGFCGDASAATAATPTPSGFSIMSVKIAVADFAKSTDFYVKYFGMKQGARYNEAEQGLEWPDPAQGATIVLVHDPAGYMKLTPGTAWIMFKVPDARKTAKAISDAGFKGVEPPVEIKQFNTVVIMVRDPDGNQIEMLQVGPAH